MAKEIKRKRTARAALPNKGLEMAYRKKLLDMIDKMKRSVIWWVGARYRAREKEIALDASPSREIAKELELVMGGWQVEFNAIGHDLSRWFVGRANGQTTMSMQNALKSAGYTVKMRNTRAVNDVLQSLIIEQTNLIKSIASQSLTEVQGLVMRSVSEGRNLGFLKEELEKRYDITERRAITIARDQTNKATESISRVRNKALGITQGIWMHRGGSLKPRQSHVLADGKVFDLSEGLLVDGEYIYPAQLVNCHCTYKPVIPTFPGEETEV